MVVAVVGTAGTRGPGGVEGRSACWWQRSPILFSSIELMQMREMMSLRLRSDSSPNKSREHHGAHCNLLTFTFMDGLYLSRIIIETNNGWMCVCETVRYASLEGNLVGTNI